MNENRNQHNEVNLEELKQLWKYLDNRVDKLEQGLLGISQNVVNGNLASSKEQLARYYKRFLFLSIIFTFLQPTLVFNHSPNYPNTNLRVITAIMFAIFFMTAAIMDGYLYNSINNINLAKLTLTEVSQKAKKLKKRHHIFQLILAPMAIATLTLFCIPLCDNKYTMFGVAFGGCVGLIIGLNYYFKIMRNYRELIND